MTSEAIMMTSNPPDRESQSRELAGVLFLARKLKEALELVDHNHPLVVNREERFAIFLDGYSGKPAIDLQILMRFEGELRDEFFKKGL